jgi:phosphoribosylamine--glycine ligase
LAIQFGSIDAFTRECVETVALPVVRHLEGEGTPFVGLLYCGLIVTAAGIRVIEFNARFGDPETQVVLPRMLTPLSDVLYASAVGDLASQPAIEFSPDAVVTVVLASENYPDTPVTGREIGGLDDASAVPGVHLTHAATALDGERLVASGGRVLSVVARGDSFTQARSRAYDALGRIELQGGQYRRDIAAKVAE